MVGVKGPYRCVYGTAGRFNVTVTVQPPWTGREEEGRRFMDGEWRAPAIIYRRRGRRAETRGALQSFCSDYMSTVSGGDSESRRSRCCKNKPHLKNDCTAIFFFYPQFLFYHVSTDQWQKLQLIYVFISTLIIIG